MYIFIYIQSNIWTGQDTVLQSNLKFAIASTNMLNLYNQICKFSSIDYLIPFLPPPFHPISFPPYFTPSLFLPLFLYLPLSHSHTHVCPILPEMYSCLSFLKLMKLLARLQRMRCWVWGRGVRRGRVLTLIGVCISCDTKLTYNKHSIHIQFMTLYWRTLNTQFTFNSWHCIKICSIYL